MEIRKIRMNDKTISEETLNLISQQIETVLKDLGFNVTVSKINSSKLRLSEIRTDKKVWYYNESPYTQRRGTVLNFNQWILVNYAINSIFDKYNLSANISSLNGKFKIRDNDKVYTVYSWESLGNENIGSMINPVNRRSAWIECNYETFKNAYVDALSYLKRYYETSNINELIRYAEIHI